MISGYITFEFSFTKFTTYCSRGKAKTWLLQDIAVLAELFQKEATLGPTDTPPNLQNKLFFLS